MLECMTPVFARSVQMPAPKRMLVIANNLGLLPKNFFPAVTGRDYALSPYLETLSEAKDEFSVFSGLSHPGVTGGHSTDNCFLTSARGAFKAGFRNSISLDQYAAEKLGQVTRFPTLNLGVNIEKANRSLSWTRDGVLLPAEDSATTLFNRMFVQGSAEETKTQLLRLKQRGSILDTLNAEGAVRPNSRQQRQGPPRSIPHVREGGRATLADRQRMGAAPQTRRHADEADRHQRQQALL